MNINQMTDDILSKICATKKDHVVSCQNMLPLCDIKARIRDYPSTRSFTKTLENAVKNKEFGLICEIKKASPSKGIIRNDFDPIKIAMAYEKGKADCLSILTDSPYFQGADHYLNDIKNHVTLPLLRKDFMIDHYQIYESRFLNADCILLILACLEDNIAKELEDIALSLGMDVLIEIHNIAELERALTMQSPLIGINNRNLKDFTVSLDTSKSLAKMISNDKIIISESGIFHYQDLCDLQDHHIMCFLVGESLMRQEDITTATLNLRYGHGH